MDPAGGRKELEVCKRPRSPGVFAVQVTEWDVLDEGVHHDGQQDGVLSCDELTLAPCGEMEE